MVNQSRKKKVVLASGVFDLLHLGHVRYLEEAKKTGDKGVKLIVTIARDKTVERIKGRKPIMPENQRLALVESLEVVDDAILGSEEFDIGKTIEMIKPDVIALGYDQREIEEKVLEYISINKLNIEVIRIGKFGKDELDSSTKIRQKVRTN